MEINDRLKDIRVTLNYKQKDFATELGISPQLLYKYEAGKLETPDSIKKVLHDKFNISLDWLITGTGEMFCVNNDGFSLKDAVEVMKELEKLHKEDKADLIRYIRNKEAQ